MPRILVAFRSSSPSRQRVPRRSTPLTVLSRFVVAQGKMMAVPLTILNTPGASDNLKPTHHMYYGNRIFDVNDDLPKFVKSKGELWTPDKDAALDES